MGTQRVCACLDIRIINERMKYALILSVLLASIANAGEINLSWSDNSDNESAFAIERATDGETFEEIALVAEDVTTYEDAELDPGTYQYRVRALNQWGHSGYTNTAEGTLGAYPNDPGDAEVAPKIVLVIAVRDDGSVALSNPDN